MKSSTPPLTQRLAQNVGLCSLSQACLGEFFDGIFDAILVYGDMNGAKGASADLLLDDILIDPVLSTSVILASHIFRPSIEGFLLGSVSDERTIRQRW